jgi:hypothetical protein
MRQPEKINTLGEMRASSGWPVEALGQGEEPEASGEGTSDGGVSREVAF